MTTQEHPAAQLPEIREYRQVRTHFDQTLRDTLPSHKPSKAHANAQEKIAAAREKIERAEALQEIERATEADVEAARSELQALQLEVQRDLEAKTRVRRRKAAVQLDVLRKDVKERREAVQAAHERLTTGDVEELREIVRKALEVNERIAATESAMYASLPHPVFRQRQIPTDAAKRLQKWLDKGE